jgi:hypothetical protein
MTRTVPAPSARANGWNLAIGNPPGSGEMTSSSWLAVDPELHHLQHTTLPRKLLRLNHAGPCRHPLDIARADLPWLPPESRCSTAPDRQSLPSRSLGEDVRPRRAACATAGTRLERHNQAEGTDSSLSPCHHTKKPIPVRTSITDNFHNRFHRIVATGHNANFHATIPASRIPSTEQDAIGANFKHCVKQASACGIWERS